MFVSYYFPPDAAVGGLRAAKFVRSLPDFGWTPVVLTVRGGDKHEGRDAERLKGLEDVRILRTREFPSLRRLYLGLKGLTRFLGAGSTPIGTFGSVPIRADSRETLMQRLKRYVISLVILLPDDKKNWAIWSTFSAIRVMRAQRIGCIVTSSPPASVHLVGLMAKMFVGSTWIADFRDPWLETFEMRPFVTRSSASDRIEGVMERLVMTHADRVITTTDRLRQSMISRYPAVPREKFVCLPNSIDTNRIPSAGTVQKYSSFTITYAGTLYFDRTPEPLFQAVRDLIDAGKIKQSDINIKLVGNCQRIDGLATRTVAERYDLGSVVEVLDPVSYSEAIGIIQKSHLALVLAPEHHELMVGAKVFDYLGSGTRILALAEQGATRDLVEQTDSGRCFSPTDLAGLREHLYELIRDGSFATLRNDPQTFHQYFIRNVTAQLTVEMSAVRRSES